VRTVTLPPRIDQRPTKDRPRIDMVPAAAESPAHRDSANGAASGFYVPRERGTSGKNRSTERGKPADSRKNTFPYRTCRVLCKSLRDLHLCRARIFPAFPAPIYGAVRSDPEAVLPGLGDFPLRAKQKRRGDSPFLYFRAASRMCPPARAALTDP
jgi:hypothetical protein